MQFTLASETGKRKAPDRSASALGKLYPPPPMVWGVLERSGMWTNSEVFSHHSRLCPQSRQRHIFHCSFSMFGSFYLPLHPFVTHVLPAIRPEKALLRPNPYIGTSLPGLDLRVQSHCPGTFLYMQMPTPRLLSLGWVSGGLSIRPQGGVDLILTHYAMKPGHWLSSF